MDLLELDDEVQRRVRWNLGWAANFAVTQLARDFELDHSPFADELKPLGPAFDHAIQSERDRHAPVIRAVELLSIVEGASIVRDDLVGRAGFAPVGLSQDSIVKSRRGRCQLV